MHAPAFDFVLFSRELISEFFVCLGILGDVVEVACDRSHLQAVAQKWMGSENYTCPMRGCTKSQQSEAPVDICQSLKKL